jgi:hypothetical protein
MNLVNQIISATGPAAPIALDWLAVPFSATVQVTFVGATATYGVEYTLDNIMTTPAASVRWTSDAASLPPGTTTAGNISYTSPRAAVRCNVTALAGGTIEFKVAQGTQ